jgi:hypothetical protein
MLNTVASLDALLRFGNDALGSDFGGLIPNPIKYIIAKVSPGASNFPIRAVIECDRKTVIDRLSEVLPASDVPFGRLHRSVTKEELNLFEFASGLMAEAGASATKIVGRQMVKADTFSVSLHGIPDYVGCHSIILPSPILRNSSEPLAFSHSCLADPHIYETFTPRRHRDRSQPSALPDHIDDHPVAFSQLQLIQS